MTLTLRSSFVAVALSASVLLGTAACGSGDGGGTASAQGGDAPAGVVSVSDATIDWPANPSVAAVRMVVRNDTPTADTLTAVSSPIAASATVHRTETDAAGRSTMEAEPRLAIPARSSVTFAPSGLHVMLTGITEDLQVGDEVKLTLTLEHAGKVHATARVVEPGSSGDAGGAHVH